MMKNWRNFIQRSRAISIMVMLVGLSIFWAAVAMAADVSSWLTTSSTSTSLNTQLSNGISIGYLKVGTADAAVISWKPDFVLGSWGLGFDFNVPAGTSNPGVQNIVFRYAKYDDGAKGIQYGVLENVTLGHGLIMKNYSTRYSTDIVLTNDQMGARGYYDFENWGLLGMATWHNVFSVGAKQTVHPRLILTEYYVTDTNGVNVTQTDGTVRNFPSQSAIGFDARVPIVGNWDAFAEAGQLLNHGSGAGIGTAWAADLLGVLKSTFSLTYRILDRNFVPGYFDVDYETNPADLSTAEASGGNKNGVLGEWAFNVANRVAANLTYEDYNDSNPSLIALADAIVSDKISASGYYKQENFTSLHALSFEDGAILGAAVTYKINPYSTVTLNYKKAYNSSSGQVEESQYYTVGFGF